MSVIACYAEKGKAVIMADSLWTDTSGNDRSIAGPLKVFEISIDVICGIAGNSAIYEVYNNLMCEFFIGEPCFFDDVLKYIDSNAERLCSFIPPNEIGGMIIAGFTDETRTDIKVAKLYFEQKCLRGPIYDKEYPRMAIFTPPDIKGVEEEELLKYVSDANENMDKFIKNADVMRLTGKGSSSTNRYLTRLVDLEILAPEGEKKGRIYRRRES